MISNLPPRSSSQSGSKIKRNQTLTVCPGCAKTKKPKQLIYFHGYYLCYHCRSRKRFPIVGYFSKALYLHEKKVLAKQRRKAHKPIRRKFKNIRAIESQALWKLYKKHGLTDLQASTRLKELKYTLKKEIPLPRGYSEANSGTGGER